MQSTEEYEVQIVLSDIVEGLLAKLRSIVTKHMSSEWDFNEGLIDLHASLTQIQLLLNDAEKRQVSDGRVRMWLTDFRDAAYDIDDALDEFGYNILQQKVQTLNQMKEKVCSSYSLSNHIVFPFNMANKVKTINKSLNGLKDKIASFDLRVEFVNSVNSIPEINLKKEIDSFLDDPENVAQIMETPPQYELKELSESDCWSLFEKRAFANKRLPPDLYVRDKEEARSANLATKAKIYKLGFYWNSFRKNYYDNNDEEVLEGLQPHQNLKSLTIEWYQGKKFPSWMLNGLSLFDNLIEITLSHCSKCEQVPTLGHLPCLRVLKIAGMNNVKCIGNEFYSDGNYGNTLFPALIILEMNYMSSLGEWKDAEELTTGEGEVFPCLEELTIKDCSNLNSIPDLRGLHSLTQLVIMSCRELAHLLEGFLDCLTPLQTLRITASRLSFCFDWRYLDVTVSSLQLKITANLNSLPDKIQRFTALKELHIEGFDVMEALPEWLGNFSSLQSLSLCYCKNLKLIPDLRGLHSLTQLVIISCPQLSHLLERFLDCLTHLKTLWITARLSFCFDWRYLDVNLSSLQLNDNG
uniref:Uncharacterized protein n=1 Tax=Fagus sylvatica TaxID=28930 RepID=A0A2N9HYS9_FAGSY